MTKGAVVMVWLALLAADRYLDMAQEPRDEMAGGQASEGVPQ